MAKGIRGTAKLRKAKWDAHAVFDPLWRNKEFRTRKHAYSWLADELGLPVKDCHIGMFDVGQCKQVIAACRKRQSTKGA